VISIDDGAASSGWWQNRLDEGLSRDLLRIVECDTYLGGVVDATYPVLESDSSILSREPLPFRVTHFERHRAQHFRLGVTNDGLLQGTNIA
jgi:hypothetical protein